MGTLLCSFTQLHYRYDMASNRWWEESHVPKKAPHNSAFGFVVLDGELHVMTLLNASDPTESRRKRNQKRAGTLYIQIYHPKKKTWRSLITKSPFPYPLDFKTAVVCSIQLWTSVLLICVVRHSFVNFNTSDLCSATTQIKLCIYFCPSQQKVQKEKNRKERYMCRVLIFVGRVLCHWKVCIDLLMCSLIWT